ncbi:MAG TPA: O-antigen ligase family protein [Pseudomonadales bacterium]|nr:O-antigen ligase family protein [Pseudomonadales bacterium]
MIVTLAGKHDRLRFLLLALTAVFFLVAVFVISRIMIAGMDTPTEQVHALGTHFFSVPNDVLMFVVVAPLALGATWVAGWWLRCLAIIYLLLAFAVTESLQSRQAIVLFFIGLVVVIALMRPRWSVPALLVGSVIGVAVDALLGWPLSHKIFLFPRTYVWQAAWAMFTDRPWTGQGPGMFKDLYFAFLAKAGYFFQELSDRRTMPWAHSLYLEQLAERGIPGFMALLYLLGASMRLAMKSWRQSSSDLMRGQAAGILAALIVFALAGLAETTLSRIWVTILLFILTAFSVAMAESLSGKTAISHH